MTHFKLILLNIVCVITLVYVTFLTGLQTIASTPRYDTDYQALYLSLHHSNDVYAEYSYAPIIPKTKTDKMSEVKTLPPVSVVNMNSPVMSLLLKGIFNVSDKLTVNAFVWSIISLLGATLGLYLLMRFSLEKFTPLYFFPFLLLMYLSWAGLYNLRLGEVSYLLLPILSLGFILQQSKNLYSLSVVLALLASLKLFFLVFVLLFVMKRQWQLLGIFVLSFLFFSFLPLFYFHFDTYHDFFKMINNDRLFMQHAVFPSNGSILGVVSRIIRLCHFSFSQVVVHAFLYVVSLCVVMLVLLYDYFFVRKLREFSDELRFSFLVMMALLLSPLAWVYYFVFLLIPIVVFFKIGQRYHFSNMFFIVFTLAVFLPYFSWKYNATGVLFYVEIFSSFASLLCWLVCLCLSVRTVQQHNVIIENQSHLFVMILTTHVLLNVILLSINYGMPYFFNLNKEKYFQSVPLVLTIQSNVKQ